MLRKTLYATDGETIKVSSQWAAETDKRATTVTDSAWAYSGSGTVSGATLVTPLATCKLTPTSCGTPEPSRYSKQQGRRRRGPCSNDWRVGRSPHR